MTNFKNKFSGYVIKYGDQCNGRFISKDCCITYPDECEISVDNKVIGKGDLKEDEKGLLINIKINSLK